MTENWGLAVNNLKKLIQLREYTNIDVQSIYFDPINNITDNYATYTATNASGAPVLIFLYRSTSETKSKSTKPRDPNRVRKFNTADMNFIISIIDDANERKGTEKQRVYYSDIILVSNRKGTNKKTPTLLKDSYYRNSLWIFHINDLSIDISEHYLQPAKFEIIPANEAKQFFANRSIKSIQVGTISTHDPLGKWYGIKAGQLIKVTDNVNLSGLLVKKMITWMVVIDRPLPPRK